MNKKIVFFLYDLSLGGTERVVVRLSNYLVNKGYKVEILTVGKTNFFRKEIDSKVKTTCFNLKRIFHSFRSLRRFIKRNDFDFFVSNVWPVTILSVIAFLFSPNLLNRLILVEHCHLKEEWNHKNLAFKAFQSISIKILYNFSKKVISVSDGVRKDLIAKGVKKNKSKVIYNPAYYELEVTSTSNLSKEINNWVTGNHIKLISVGNFKTQKNYPNLIKAMDVLKNKKKLDCKLLIAGDGPERLKIEKVIEEKRLEKDVILLGYHTTTLSLINLSDIFVLASDFEGFGLVIVEAISLGKTVVSTDCKSGPSEIIKNNEFGYLCKVNDPIDLAEKIEFSINNRIEEQKLKKRAKDFSISNIGPEYEEVFN